MDKSKFPLYEYLNFIWKKKYYVIGFTLLCIALAIAFSYGKQTVYTSTALVFTGNGNNDKLSKPDLIIHEYEETLPEDIKSTFNVNIKEPFQITLSLKGTNKQYIEEHLNKVAALYTQDLKDRYHEQINIREKYVEALDNKIRKNDEALSLFKKLISEGKNEDNQYLEALLHFNKEENLKNSGYYEEELFVTQFDLELAEPPEFINTTTTQTNNNLLRNTLLAAAFGIQLMIIILVLIKYIVDARKSLN